MDKKYIYKNSHKLKEIRQALRFHATTTEKILWKFLKGRQLDGYKFRRQFSIMNVIADFCCEELKLIIELDGWTHDFEKTQAKDLVKQKLLESCGYQVIRYKNEQVYGDIDLLWKDLLAKCRQRADDLNSKRFKSPPSF